MKSVPRVDRARRRTARAVPALGVAMLAALTLGASACKKQQAVAKTSLQTTNVVRGALRITAEATGTVEPIRKVEVKSKASGEILKLAVDVGDQVRTGALLATIDPRDVKNSDEQADADLEVAKARLEISQAQNKRSKELLDGGVITAQEYENSRLDLANAQAALVKAQTNKSLAELRLGDVTITAPLTGTIIQKSVEEGQVIQSASQNVSGGTTLFVMANLNEMQVRTLVDETDMGQVRAGMPASVKVEAFPDRQFQGYVEKVEPQGVVQQNVTMFPVIVRLDNREGTLRPGMNADVEILVDEASDILLVPNNAVVLPQDVAAAAEVLGLDPTKLDLAALGARGRGGRAGRPDGEAGAAGTSAAPAGGAPTGPAATPNAQQTPAPAGAFGGPAMDSLRARVQRGEISRDSARALTRGLSGGGGGFRGGQRLDSARAGGGASAGPRRQLRRAVVFVVNAEGRPEPKPVQLGLNDYDHTEIVSGLNENDPIALLGAAELQAQQQQVLNRIRQGAGQFGPLGGGVVVRGGPGGGGPGR